MLTTIPDMLVANRGNITALAGTLGVNRATVRTYARDFKGDKHLVKDGALFTITRRNKCKPT